MDDCNDNDGRQGYYRKPAHPRSAGQETKQELNPGRIELSYQIMMAVEGSGETFPAMVRVSVVVVASYAAWRYLPQIEGLKITLDTAADSRS